MAELKRPTEKEDLLRVIKETELLLSDLKAELEKLETLEMLEKEPEFKPVPKGEKYYSIFLVNHGVEVVYDREDQNECSAGHFKNNNYFHTEDRTFEVAEKIRFLLRLERFHDTYSPSYKPDWECKADKYCVYYDGDMKEYCVDWTESDMNPTGTYFPNDKTAQKVCNMLNKELKKEN